MTATATNNGWNRQASRGVNSIKSPRKPFSGQYSLKYNNTKAFFETIKERLTFTLKSLAGAKVKVKLDSGIILHGILIASSRSCVVGEHITLKYCSVKFRPDGNKDSFPEGPNKYVLKWENMVYVHGLDKKKELFVTGSQKLKTDADIRRGIQAGKISGRKLEAPDSSWVQKSSKANTLSATFSSSKTVWDQFQVNEEKFGVKGTFDEKLYTTPLDKTALTKEQIDKAKKTAAEIVSSASSHAHVREERNQDLPEASSGGVAVDEETRYSAVLRPKNSPRTTTTVKKQPLSKKPLSFADALMKGQRTTEVVAEKTESTPQQQQQQQPKVPLQRHPITTPTKYKIQGNIAEAKKRKERAAASNTPGTKDWASHTLIQSKKAENARSRKTREEQIAEFKQFSSKLSERTSKEKKQLNVHAKEFEPSFSSTTGGNPTGQQFPGRQSNTPGGQYFQHPGGGMWPMPVGHLPPMNFLPPGAMMMPPGSGQQMPMYPQPGGVGNSPYMFPPGQPYLVHMMPPGGMPPIPQHLQQPQQQQPHLQGRLNVPPSDAQRQDEASLKDEGKEQPQQQQPVSETN